MLCGVCDVWDMCLRFIRESVTILEVWRWREGREEVEDEGIRR